MRSYRAMIVQPGRCEIEVFDLPTELGPDDVLVEAEVTLLSPGTELVIYTGRHSALNDPESVWPKFPVTPGYSMVGRVLARGSQASGVEAGDRVFAAASHAAHAIVPASKLMRISDDLASSHAAFAELGAIAMNGVRRAQVALGESVCVVGLGLIGVLAMRLARLCGAMPLIAVDLSEPRRAVAKQLGADIVIDPAKEDVLARVRGAGGGRAADVVIEATGVPRVVVSCIEWVRDQGRVMLLGSPHGSIDVNFYSHVHRRSLSLIGIHVMSSVHEPVLADPWNLVRNRRTFLDLLRRGDISVEPLISRTIVPQELDSVYRSLAASAGATLGVIIDWKAAAKDIPPA